ncbi:bifunctional diaminohydroxyphosphoribosylaminopyrimidine deaminase/5-amino-6-(5-phosphoribosylamino)uracil reductase RibD (plasmid) [Deinococcus radiomollis]|uniref:bifunctional diaminohydroxyphosphoribosylaminopyrimidine deaminase/5-amino-6-(5-phosphoribosylamino)uracil reductase RibD n=1 Tax=Deinococcus radiomollis TaxID=468916 RepID=UPI003891699A
MREALILAQRGVGRTAPNPPVGCVMVQGGTVVGRGFHLKAGEPHAEVFALREAGERARGSTVYVTLEPCSHHGQTPPCADALIGAGIHRVVVATLDPNPAVSGRGVEKLRAAGIAVDVGILADEAVIQQAGFRSLVTWGRPWVVLKYAMTLDGKVATLSGDSRWVTGEAARTLVHHWRNELDAIAVGSGTVLADRPSLTTRNIDGGRNPVRVVFDRRGRTDPGAAVLGLGSILITGVETASEPHEARGTRVLRASSVQDALPLLGSLGLSTLLLEGGPALIDAFLEADLIDEVRVFVAPKLLGAGQSPLGAPSPKLMKQALDLSDSQVQQVGPDVLIQGRLHAIPTLERSR